jgi:hypothetical protein
MAMDLFWLIVSRVVPGIQAVRKSDMELRGRNERL